MLGGAGIDAAEKLKRHLLHLSISSHCTQQSRRLYWPEAVMVTVEGVIHTLHQAGIRFVLMGNYGLTGWRKQARATQDVDVLVRKKDIRKTLRVLQQAYPDLELRDTLVVARFYDPAVDDVVIDVMKPTQEIFKAVFRHTIPVGDTHEIPNLEMALVTKFAAMTSPNRRTGKKMQDAVDFLEIVSRNRNDIDLRKLRRLSLLLYAEAGDEIMKMIEDIDAGRSIQV
jgi:hypothetical protein